MIAQVFRSKQPEAPSTDDSDEDAEVRMILLTIDRQGAEQMQSEQQQIFRTGGAYPEFSVKLHREHW